jgi:hypothetical protein
MLSTSRRHILIIVLLLAGLGVDWAQRRNPVARLAVPTATLPSQADEAEPIESQVYGADTGGGVYFADVEGWYRVTPYETAVRSPYDFSANTTETLAAALPATLGEWRQSGPDKNLDDDPAVVHYLNHPTIAFQRTYQDALGQELTLAILGNKGEDSFLLFSHTPETCYPGRLWSPIARRRESARLEDGTMHAEYLLSQQAESGEKLMVLYWYLWGSPERDSRDGVLSMRVNLFVPPGQSEEAVLARAWDFIRLLFPSAVPWERF